jgi:hypothetical protein
MKRRYNPMLGSATATWLVAAHWQQTCEDSMPTFWKFAQPASGRCPSLAALTALPFKVH